MDKERGVLSLKNLFGFLDALPSSRCIGEGEVIVNAHHIITCGILEETSKCITVFALCLKTSALMDKPHEIIDEDVQVNEFVCSCKAGQSKSCKHIAAILIMCTRGNILDFPTLSSTDKSCYWSKAGVSGSYAAAPILSHKCFSEKATAIIKPTKEVNASDIISRFTNSLPDSALSKHIEKRSAPREENKLNNVLFDLSDVNGNWMSILNNAAQSVLKQVSLHLPTNDCCKSVLTELGSVDVAVIAVKTKNDRKKWLKQRQFRITSSRCYAILTYSQNDWQTKSNKYFWAKSFCSKYTSHGKKFESVARDVYKTEEKCEVQETGLIVSAHHPWLAYSPDGIVMESEILVKLIEIKCPIPNRFLNVCSLANIFK